MPNGRITKRSIDAFECEPGKDRTVLWDDSLTGFGLVAFPSGKKVFVVQYRQDGASRRATVGEFGRLTAEEARIEAKRLLGSVAHGVDPIAKKKEQRALPTFRELAADFMRDHAAAKLAAKTVIGYESLLRLHILPSIGGTRVTDIKRADVSVLHKALKPTPYIANGAIRLISSIWGWAASLSEDGDETYASNPTSKIILFKEKARETFLDPEQLGRLGDALAEAETVGLPYKVDETKEKAKHAPKAENRRRVIDPFAVAAIRLLILTGARMREILHARWSSIDVQRKLLNVPESKTGKKVIYWSPAALAVLSALPRIAGNDFVFAGKIEGKPRVDLARPWPAIRKAAGLDGVRLHDLRHSFAAVGAASSLGLPIIGKLLGHTQASTTMRYAHLAADPIRAANDGIGSAIAEAMGRQAAGERIVARPPVFT